MRRLVLIATALGVLVVAAVAYAAENNYSATVKLTSKVAGSATKPAAVGYTEDYKASSSQGNARAAILTNIKTTIYGLRADGKDFPTCSAAKINKAHSDSVCPKGSMVASGFITAQVGGATDFTTPGAPCTPLLHVYNVGQGKLTFLFVEQGSHQCVGLATDSVPPYPGTYKVVGKNLVVNVPIPKDVDYPLGPQGGVSGSLETEHLVWVKATKKVHGKTVAAISTVGCQGKKRPFAVAFTSAKQGGGSETVTKKGSAPCS